jgi:inactivated superfamily I helicase
MMQKHLDKAHKEDRLIAKEIDSLAEQYNKETDIFIKSQILEKRSKLFNQLKKSHKEWERINKLQDANHQYWEKIYAESKKEKA